MPISFAPRKRRPRIRATHLESLESRRLLARIDAGVNVTGNDDWSTMGAWVNVGHLFRRWGDFDRPWEEEPGLTFTDQGIPLQDAGAITYLRGYDSGIYHLQYEGTGEVSFRNRAQLVAGTLQTVSGVTSAEVAISDPVSGGDELVYLRLRNVDPNDPIRNLKLIAPGYPVDTDQVFRDIFVDRLSPFSTLRFMDWNRTNSSQAQDWSQRRQPDEFIQTATAPAAGGVAWEHMIELANATGTDAWINVPHLVAADAVLNDTQDPDNTGDTYLRELARLWRDGLNAEQKVIVEYSNEPWNCIFAQCRDGQYDYYTVVAPRLAEISRIFHQEFAGQEDRLEIVLAGQSANAYHATRGMQYFSDNGIADRVDAIAIAPYFREDASVAFTELDSLFASVTHPVSGISAHASLAETRGVELYAYEGGQHLVPGNTSLELIQTAQSDPRMADEYERSMQLWEQAGGGLFAFYSFVGYGGNSGFWGMLDEIDTPGSQKWDAVMRGALEPGDADGDRQITFDDFVRLRDHYGSGQWWLHGDFDGDNDVDPDDFLALFDALDLNSLSSEQCDQVYAFAAQYSIAIPAKDAAQVTIEATDDQMIEEENDGGQFTFRRDATQGALTVYYTLVGTAAQDDIQEPLTGTVEFQDGQAEVILDVHPFDDQHLDDGEILTLQVIGGTDYFAGVPDRASITIFDNEPLVYDGFDQPGLLDGSENGWGWDEGWAVWDFEAESPRYVIENEEPLDVGSLLSSPAYMIGSEKITGRRLDVTGTLSEFRKPNSTQLGRDGTTLWMSAVMSRHATLANGDPGSRITLHTSADPYAEWTHRVGVGFQSWGSNNGQGAYWTLIDNDETPENILSDVPIELDEPTLLVLKFEFGTNQDTVSLFVNPQIGIEPTQPNAQTTVPDLEFRSLGYRSGVGENIASVDEIRFGESYLAVTPQRPLDTTPPKVLDVALNGLLSDPPDLGFPQPTNWQQQRSEIRSISVAFSEDVYLERADVTLLNLGLTAEDTVQEISLDDAVWTHVGSAVTLEFAPGALGDGVYQLEISPNVRDLAGNLLDGDNAGTAGTPFVMTGNQDNGFYALAGEFNGDGGVSIFDFSTFGYWFGQTAPLVAPTYVDLNGDGGVSIFDFSIFAAHFGAAIGFPTVNAAPNRPNGELDDAMATAERLTNLADFLLDFAHWYPLRHAKKRSEPFA
ncbi:MAG: hypothetical protein KDA60_13635 [Planctomycetales bacterium]|nr:hypothetical protein [Planctomycetales bacterium]